MINHNSGKTTAGIMELIRRASEMPAQQDGIRRSRAVVVRNTLQQLKSTFLVSWMEWFRPVSNYKVSDQTIQVRFPLPDKTYVHLDVFLLPLDTPENVQRLLSLEITFGVFSEFRELNLEVVQGMISRCGRYPSRVNVQEYWYGAWGESNSFSEDSDWYEQLDLNRPANWEYFVQPGAFEPNAENRQYLPPRYYEDMLESNSPDWVDQYIHNQITPSLSGQAVFRSSFSTRFHIAENELAPIPGYPMIIGMDFARHPAAVLGQIDNKGRLLILAECEHENMGVERFVQDELIPLLHQPRFAGIPSYIVGDPAGVSRGQIGEESVFDALERLNFVAIPAMTNAIDPRLRAVEKWLLKYREGEALMLFDPVNAPLLIQSMQSKYRYKIRKSGEMEDKPDKVRPWADLADALQYLCLGTASNLRGRVMNKLNPKRRHEAPMPPSAWT